MNIQSSRLGKIMELTKKRSIIRQVAIICLLFFWSQAYAAQSLKSVTSSQLDNGVVQIVIEGTEEFSNKPASFSVDTPPRIIVDVEGASSLDKKTFKVDKAGVDSVVIVEANDRARLVARLQSKQPYTIETKGKSLVLSIGEPGKKAVAVDPTSTAMSSTPVDQLPDAGKLSLNFQDIEVRSVLQLLADFTGLNMVVSDTVRGNVTLRLKDVHWKQALDIILKTKGLTMRQEGNIIMVAPTAEVAAQEQLTARSEKTLKELKPIKSDLLRIKYAKAADLARLLEEDNDDTANGQSFLSDRGSVSVDERTNSLLIRETEENLSEIRALIAKLDKPIQQVLIESRIVIANDDFAKELGVKLGFGATDTAGGTGVNVGGGTLGGNASSDFTTGEGYAGGGFIAFGLDFGAGDVLNLELAAMQQEGQGEIVSSPRVVTSDQNTARIEQGVEVPYQTVSQDGTRTEFKDASLSLEVTPHITPDNKVIMDLQINKDNPDFANATPDGVPIETRAIQTSVLVDDGATIVLGGIFEETDATTQTKVPVLGDIPAIGRLFRSDKKDANKTELMVFVTPKILRR